MSFKPGVDAPETITTTVTSLGKRDVWAVPSKSEPGVMRYVIEAPTGYWCSCMARRLCWHIRAVVRFRIERGSR